MAHEWPGTGMGPWSHGKPSASHQPWWAMMSHDEPWWAMMSHDEPWWAMLSHDEPWWAMSHDLSKGLQVLLSWWSASQHQCAVVEYSHCLKKNSLPRMKKWCLSVSRTLFSERTGKASSFCSDLFSFLTSAKPCHVWTECTKKNFGTTSCYSHLGQEDDESSSHPPVTDSNSVTGQRIVKQPSIRSPQFTWPPRA